MTIEELQNTIENLEVPLDDRMKALIMEVGRLQLPLQTRAYLGEVLLDTITEEDRKGSLEGKIIQLQAKINRWRQGNL